MTPKEAWQLLTIASARDGRTVDKAVATVWASDLAWIPLDIAVEAAQRHYRESADWLMPVHVIRHAARIREERERAERRANPRVIAPNVVTKPDGETWARMVEEAKQQAKEERKHEP